jgi:hypothetical protein
MQIDESAEQYENADCSIRDSLEPHSNVTDESPHAPKHSSQRISTEDGMQIVESDEQPANADGPIRESVETGSKTTVERVVNPEKHACFNSRIQFGITISDTLPKVETIESVFEFTKNPS